MAKKSKRVQSTVSRVKSKARSVKAKAAVKAKTPPKAKAGMKAKAVKLLEKISAKVSAARADVKGRAEVGSKALAKAGAKAKASARRTFRHATSKATSKEREVAAQLAHNKQLVLDFYHKLIGEKDYEGARHFMGEEYRQHAPYASDGHAGVAEWVRKFKEGFPDHHYDVKKVIAEGDLVVLHLHGKSGHNPFGESVVDIFRIKDGKVVEHWDVIQPIPDNADNANTMF
jgi:predicted SnoaL-like aldol condensation-catalyzing enzyme